MKLAVEENDMKFLVYQISIQAHYAQLHFGQ